MKFSVPVAGRQAFMSPHTVHVIGSLRFSTDGQLYETFQVDRQYKYTKPKEQTKML